MTARYLRAFSPVMTAPTALREGSAFAACFWPASALVRFLPKKIIVYYFGIDLNVLKCQFLV